MGAAVHIPGTLRADSAVSWRRRSPGMNTGGHRGNSRWPPEKVRLEAELYRYMVFNRPQVPVCAGTTSQQAPSTLMTGLPGKPMSRHRSSKPPGYTL
jgi:hypothetical protein